MWRSDAVIQNTMHLISVRSFERFRLHRLSLPPSLSAQGLLTEVHIGRNMNLGILSTDLVLMFTNSIYRRERVRFWGFC